MDEPVPKRRLFIALRFPETTRQTLVKAEDTVVAFAGKARPTLPQNLHLTLAFLGMQDEQGYNRACEALKATAAQCHTVKSTLGEPGVFPCHHQLIVWEGLEKNENLKHLQRCLTEELTQRGFALEQRPFVPHITLARSVRLKKDQSVEELKQRISAVLKPDQSTHTHLYLMLSHRVDNVLTYTPLVSELLLD